MWINAIFTYFYSNTCTILACVWSLRWPQIRFRIFVCIPYLRCLAWMIQYTLSISLHIWALLISCEPFNNFCEDTSTVAINQTGYNLISHIFCWCTEHFFQLSCRKSPNNNIFLLFFVIIFHLKLSHAHLPKLLLIHRFQKPFASFFHLNQARLKSLPQLIVLSPSGIRRVPDIMLNELLYRHFPLRLNGNFFDGFERNHQPGDVLDEHIIARYQQFIVVRRRQLHHRGILTRLLRILGFLRDLKSGPADGFWANFAPRIHRLLVFLHLQFGRRNPRKLRVLDGLVLLS